MRIKAIAAAVLACASIAGSAQAIPTYRPDVVKAFKDICMGTLTTGQSVQAIAMAKGWQPTTLVPINGTPLSKSWSPLPGSPLFVANNLLGGSTCSVGYYGGSGDWSAPGLEEKINYAAARTSRALYALGWRVAGDDSKLLVIQLPHLSKQYPDKMTTLWVTNWEGAPTVTIELDPKN